jgi:hypothetical protein
MSVSGHEAGAMPELTASKLQQKLQKLLREKGKLGQHFIDSGVVEVRRMASVIDSDLLPGQAKLALVPDDEDSVGRSHYAVTLTDMMALGKTLVGFSRDYFQPGLGEVVDVVTYLFDNNETANRTSGRSYLKMLDQVNGEDRLVSLPESHDVPYIGDIDVFEINHAVEATAWPVV